MRHRDHLHVFLSIPKGVASDRSLTNITQPPEMILHTMCPQISQVDHTMILTTLYKLHSQDHGGWLQKPNCPFKVSQSMVRTFRFVLLQKDD